MLGILLPGGKKVIVKHFPEPQPGPDDVLLRVRASAICGSDVYRYEHGCSFVGLDCAHIIPGHEVAGEVEGLGEQVTAFTKGDKVAVYLFFGCGSCKYCQSGEIMLCNQRRHVGSSINGGDAEFVAVPAETCLPMPKKMSFDVGSISTDAFGTLYSASKRLKISGDDTVAIFGAGPMGSAGILVNKALGAKVIALDVADERLKTAKNLGADFAINASTEQLEDSIRDLTYGDGASACIDCSGSKLGVNAALGVASKNGRVALVGECSEAVIHPSLQLIRKRLTVIGSWYFNKSEYTDIARLVVDKIPNASKIITHRFKLEDAKQAFDLLYHKKALKAIFAP